MDGGPRPLDRAANRRDRAHDGHILDIRASSPLPSLSLRSVTLSPPRRAVRGVQLPRRFVPRVRLFRDSGAVVRAELYGLRLPALHRPDVYVLCSR